MLTDMIVEEEFEIKEEEPWYDPQDLEHDLHLAAELGKTLLDRNRELEQGLQQMYSTNQEQVQEIEYLSKQVELLRQMNEQHAKVYEQLDMAARDLENGNQRLVQDNRAAQQKIQGLSETVEGLQTHVEELQRQVEGLSSHSSDRPSRPVSPQRRSLGAPSMSGFEELSVMHKCLAYDQSHEDDPSSTEVTWEQEENALLKRSVQNLQSQLEAERALREEAEQEAELLARENVELERRLMELEGCQARLKDLQAEAEELRQLWRSQRPEEPLPDCVFFSPEEQEQEEAAGPLLEGRPVSGQGRFLQRCSSESRLGSGGAHQGHERACMRRAAAAKHRGVSLLSEVDAQYSALQVKYEELLRRSQWGADEQSHKAVQTPGAQGLRRHSRSVLFIEAQGLDSGTQQPEYKALFQEIFTCIQKTKDDLSENRGKLTRPQAE